MSKIIQDTADVTIYQIEAQFPANASQHYRLRWYKPGMGPGYFGEKHAKHGESWDEVCPLYKEYGAGGDCWQTTGEDGFLDEGLAWKAIDRIIKHAPKNEHINAWRLVRRRVQVTVDVLREHKVK